MIRTLTELFRRAAVPLVVLTLATAVLTVPLARPVAAHATLLSSAPADDQLLDAAPPDVRLQFDEAVEVVAGAVRVFGPDGSRVDRSTVDREDGGAQLVIPLDDPSDAGTYTVAWRVLSRDGHDISGTFLFHVGRETGAAAIDDDTSTLTAVAGAAGRWLAIAGSLVLVGAVLVRELARRAAAVDARLRRLAVAAAACGTAGAAIVLVTHAADASGRDLLDALSLVPDLVTDSRTGLLTALRVGALAASLAVSLALWKRAAWLAAALGVTALVLLSASGHAWTATSRGVAVASDVVHAGAAAVWAGGLVALLVALGAAGDHAPLARRFSRAALLAAIAVAISGAVSGLVQVGSWDALTSTPYGILLLTKVGGFAGLVFFGWINRTQLLPMVERAVQPLRRSVGLEAGIAALVLVSTAALIDTEPARDAVERPFSTTVTTDDGTLQVDVTPARAGANDVHLYFFDPAGVQPQPYDAVEVQASTADLPPRRLEVSVITASHMSAYGADLSAPGAWTLEVTAVASGEPDDFTVEVPIR